MKRALREWRRFGDTKEGDTKRDTVGSAEYCTNLCANFRNMLCFAIRAKSWMTGNIFGWLAVDTRCQLAANEFCH
jgi:hypothetical protein